jgi:hypothetical protein
MCARADWSRASQRRALSLLRQIQKHKVEIDNKPVVGTGRVQPDQRDLFKAPRLTAPTENSAL